MPKIIAPGVGLGYAWDLGESGAGVKTGLDDNFLTTSVLLNLSVVSRTVEPPGTPTNYSMYIIPSGPNINKIAVRIANEWRYFVPKRNWEARVVDEGDAKVVFNGFNWVRADLVVGLTGIVKAPESSILGYDFLTLTVPSSRLSPGMVFEAQFFGTQSQAAGDQELKFYVKVNGGPQIDLASVGSGADAQSYRAFSGRALLNLFSLGATASYSVSGEMTVNGLPSFASTSASPRVVNASAGLTLAFGVKRDVSSVENFEHISSAVVRQVK